MQWHHRWLSVWLCASIIFCSACAAVIERKSGPRIVGHIDRSDETQLFVTTQDDERYAIERSDIVAIDHPGKPAMWLGGGGFLAGAGLTGLAARGGSRTEPFGADSGRMQGAAKRGILEVFKRAATQQPVPKTPERRRGDFHHGLLGFYAASSAENCTENCPSGFIGLLGFMGVIMIIESLPVLASGYWAHSRSVAAAAMPPLGAPTGQDLPTLPPPGASKAQ